MPYTLPQDSTLFLSFGEKNIDTWKGKLDWIAENGGLALLNVHPDYIEFNGTRTDRSFPVSYYRDFLLYVKTRYGSSGWMALPAQVGRYCAEIQPVRASSVPKRVAMISYSFYRSDNRVMRYAEALAERGDSVDVIALRRETDTNSKRHENIRGVNLYQVQSRVRNEKGKASYLWRLLRFWFVSSAFLSLKHLRKGYDAIHVHNVPDFLVLAAWLPKLTGARIILDIHDILPEFFASKFSKEQESRYVRVLKWIERVSCRFADHVIISNDLWHKTITERSVPAHKCTSVINYLDTRVFYPRIWTRSDDKLIAIFPGGLQWHQGLDIAIRAFPRVLQRFPQAEFHIYGEGNMKEEWKQLTQELKLEQQVLFFDPLPLREIAEKIANSDIGIVPKRADSFGNEAYSTKIMEFMSQGIPVVASRTKIDTFYFDDTLIAFFESGNHDELAEKILEVLGDANRRQSLITNGLAYVNQNNWNRKKQEYFDILDGNTRPASGRAAKSVRPKIDGPTEVKAELASA